VEKGSRVGRYELLDKLGEGGMAEVWKGRNVGIDLIVAVKLLLERFAKDADLERRFLNEGRIQARLRHPNIVSAFDADSADGRSYLVMDYVEGQTLEARLAAHGGKPLPAGEVLAISYDVLAALEYAHTLPEGPIVHRDVKPSNILIDKAGRARLTDFGIALALNEQRKTRFGVAPGSVFYMSPEQITSPRAVDGRSDIYSFGCVLYEMLTGRPPFGSDSDTDFTIREAHVSKRPEPMRQSNVQVPFAFEWIVLRALQKDPARRFSTAAEMAQALKKEFPDVQETPPAPVPGPVPVPPVPPGPIYDDRGRDQVKPHPVPTPNGGGGMKWILGAVGIAALVLIAWLVWPQSARIQSVRFYTTNELGMKNYDTHFVQNHAGPIHFEATLTRPAAANAVVKAVWHAADGQGSYSMDASADSGSTTVDGEADWKDTGGNVVSGPWPVGTQTVEFTIGDQSPVDETFDVDPPVYDVPSLNADVAGPVRFFGGPLSPIPDFGSRDYADTFTLNDNTHFVYWELPLRFAAGKAPADFKIDSVWYHNDNQCHQYTENWTQGDVVPIQNGISYYIHGYYPVGEDPATGPYRVEISIDGQKIASGMYTITE